ncbi:MAG: VPLPA-CTERM sorting domain-containing protein [Pseudomonadota bacterium]
MKNSLLLSGVVLAVSPAMGVANTVIFTPDPNTSPAPVAYLQDGLRFTTGTPQSAWGTGNATRLGNTFRAEAGWSGGGQIGALGTTTVPNPAWGLYELCVLSNAPICIEPEDVGPRRFSVENGAQAQVQTSGSVGVELNYELTAGQINPAALFNVEASVPVIDRSFDTDTSYSVHRIEGVQILADGEINILSPGARASINALLDVSFEATAEGCIAGACESISGTLIDVDNQSIELLGFDGQRLNVLKGLTDLLPFPADISVPIAEAEALIVRGVPLNQSEREIGVAINTNQLPGFPSGPTVDLASIKAEFPTVAERGAKSGDTIVANGNDRVLTVSADWDGLLNEIPAGGVTFPVGNDAFNASITLEAYDIDTSITVDMYQDLVMTPELNVRLDFDTPVRIMERVFVEKLILDPIFGIPIGKEFIPEWRVAVEDATSWTGKWTNIPYMYFGSTTTVTPTFFTEVKMSNQTGLQFGLAGTVSAGRVAASAGVGAPLTGSFGPLVSETLSIPLDFARIPVFSDTFTVTGFSGVQGTPFEVAVLSQGGFQGPGPVAPPLAPVPLPLGAWMLLSGLGTLGVMRHQRGARESL